MKRELRNPIHVEQVGEWVVATMWTRQEGSHTVFRHPDILVADRIAWDVDELTAMLAGIQKKTVTELRP